MIDGSDAGIVPEDVAALSSRGHLSPEELWRLTLLKWRYDLGARGLEFAEVEKLLFLKWLYVTGRVSKK